MPPSPVDPYPPAAFYFTVGIGPLPPALDSSFREVSGIGAELELETVVEGGENRFAHQLPKGVKHPRLVLKRGVAPFTSPLVVWCRNVLEGGLGSGITTKSVRVALMNHLGVPLRLWSFQNAFPVKWDVEPFNSTKNEVAMEKVELAYAVSLREL